MLTRTLTVVMYNHRPRGTDRHRMSTTPLRRRELYSVYLSTLHNFDAIVIGVCLKLSLRGHVGFFLGPAGSAHVGCRWTMLMQGLEGVGIGQETHVAINASSMPSNPSAFVSSDAFQELRKERPR